MFESRSASAMSNQKRYVLPNHLWKDTYHVGLIGVHGVLRCGCAIATSTEESDVHMNTVRELLAQIERLVARNRGCIASVNVVHD